MLLEVSGSTEDMSFHKAEQQLLSLQKVYYWFESNKHVLMKSDGVSFYHFVWMQVFYLICYCQTYVLYLDGCFNVDLLCSPSKMSFFTTFNLNMPTILNKNFLAGCSA